MTIRSYDEGYDEGVAAERARCVALVQHRVKLWNDSLRADMHGDCAMSLAEECEDIAAAIQRG